MTQEEFKTLKPGQTLISPLGNDLTIAEAKRNAKGETVRVTYDCEIFEVKK